MAKSYYVFKGQNASTGVPNKKTGRMSFFGSILKFDSKNDALKFVDEHDRGYAQQLCIAGTKKTMRKYCLGMTVKNIEECLSYIEITKKNDAGCWEINY